MNFNIIITTEDTSTRLTSPLNRINADRLCRTIEATGVASARMVAAPKVIPPESRMVTHSHGSTVYCVNLSAMDVFILKQMFNLTTSDGCLSLRGGDCVIAVHGPAFNMDKAVRTHRRLSNSTRADRSYHVRPFVCDSMYRYN